MGGLAQAIKVFRNLSAGWAATAPIVPMADKKFLRERRFTSPIQQEIYRGRINSNLLIQEWGKEECRMRAESFNSQF
jgi:hypothetical protein